jgi:hypothetical protein
VILLIAGSSVFLLTAALFWRFLPRGGKRHRFVGTEWSRMSASLLRRPSRLP